MNSSHEVLSHDDFVRRAEEILGFIAQQRSEAGLRAAISEAIERYVDDETHPELKHFSEVITLARRQATLQEHLDADRENLHHGHLSHEEATSVGHHYEMLRHEACTFNHLMRGLIESSSQYFSRDELMGWLVAASQGRADWARAETTGAISEITLHAALQGLPELRELRYGTVEEDLRGYDFVATWQGSMLTIDAKTGFYPPLSEQKHGHRHLEISVPREAVDGFRITRHGLDSLRAEVRQTLHRETGVESHAPHHYFQAASA